MEANSPAATITIDVTNTAPVAVAGSYATPPGQALNVAAPGVLLNDTDAENDPLTAQLDSSPSNGAVVLNADGSFTYTPDAGFLGVDTFTYSAYDGLHFERAGGGEHQREQPASHRRQLFLWRTTQ